SILTFLLLGLAIGYAASLGRIRQMLLTKRGGVLGSGGYLVGLAIFMFAALITSASIAHVVVAEILINRSIVTLNTTGDLGLSSHYVSQALRIYPQDTRGQRAAVELGLLQIQKIAAETPTDQTTAQLKKIIEDTIQYGLRAVSLNGDDYQNWLELAMLYQELAGANVGGAYENAKDAYAKLIADNPTNPIAYLKRAQLELLQKNTDAAIADLVIAVKLKPDFAAAYYLASQIYASTGDFASALPPALSAAQVASGDPLAWYNLGAIAYAGGDYTNAALALERALDLQPQYANALYALGLSYYQLGRVDDAKRILGQLNKLNPNQQIVREIIDNLNAGKPPFSEASTPVPEASDGKN
ncbi:tetratricopeptide repeat protein, partial [Candidatus Kaiserbacteria bacterium]|nr:tetratricopeptide repeat protein [Candidatus Kaiserbacteria bacterium]